MYQYKIRGSDEIEGKAKKIGKAIAVIVNREWEGKQVMVIKEPELIGKNKEVKEKI